MFDFSMYGAHQKMIDLESEGVQAFLRDETGSVISLCNDGNVYCNITTFNWVEPRVRQLWIETVLNATAAGIDGIFAGASQQSCVHGVFLVPTHSCMRACALQTTPATKVHT